MIGGGLGQIMEGRKVKSYIIVTVGMPRKLSKFMDLLVIIRIPSNYGNICEARFGGALTREF